MSENEDEVAAFLSGKYPVFHLTGIVYEFNAERQKFWQEFSDQKQAKFLERMKMRKISHETG